MTSLSQDSGLQVGVLLDWYPNTDEGRGFILKGHEPFHRPYVQLCQQQWDTKLRSQISLLVFILTHKASYDYKLDFLITTAPTVAAVVLHPTLVLASGHTDSTRLLPYSKLKLSNCGLQANMKEFKA